MTHRYKAVLREKVFGSQQKGTNPVRLVRTQKMTIPVNNAKKMCLDRLMQAEHELAQLPMDTYYSRECQSGALPRCWTRPCICTTDVVCIITRHHVRVF